MKVEVAAIMERIGTLRTIAISPDANTLYVWKGKNWVERRPGSARMTALDHWNFRASAGRKIYRGIFTIDVED